ncbi:ATP-binding cassette domain-containing protein [Lederbergia citrea]|uniref:ATP-binding cassette domain-containing protein n=1 Tax=Lederbergia citrea TaxID=2833581 RepID=UPI0020162172|nr:ATP-binding cassette domain-containing protein [Lederbergia citrea]
MKQPKVVFKNVVKEYTLFKKKSDKLVEFFMPKKGNHNFYAVRDVSFEVYAGETIGIIGINGSGKSTLSNLLAQVVPPTSGSIEIDGETSLIAISVGLNNQLSGLENIELKCLMHGMGMDEIKRIKPLIIEFADIGNFIDQPVKNYSSGMRSRLGFAISVHTNPDILVVDEALSVGDQTFYDKCMTKIQEFKDSGKTIFFISHSLSQIKQLSDRVLWMQFGEVKEFGETRKVINLYKEFITWFNNLSEKEKKQYKREMFEKQSGHHSFNNNRQISRKEKNRGAIKRDNINPFYKIQLSILSLLLIFSMFFMVLGNPAEALVHKFSELTLDKSGGNEVDEEKMDSAIKKLNENGFIQVNSADVFRNEDLTEKYKELNFANEVKVLAKVDQHVYQIEQNNEIGYTSIDNIDTEINSLQSIDITINELLPMLSESFNDSYQFYLAFLGGEETQLKEKMRGITEELNEESQKKIVLGYEDITYLVHEGLVNGITVKVTDSLPTEVESKLKGHSIVSTDEKLWSFKSSEYKFFLNLEADELTIQFNNKIDYAS